LALVWPPAIMASPASVTSMSPRPKARCASLGTYAIAPHFAPFFAASFFVRGQRYGVDRGRDARDLRVGPNRDRAAIAVMLFGFVRVGAAVKMRVRDFEDEGKDAGHPTGAGSRKHARRCVATFAGGRRTLSANMATRTRARAGEIVQRSLWERIAFDDAGLAVVPLVSKGLRLQWPAIDFVCVTPAMIRDAQGWHEKSNSLLSPTFKSTLASSGLLQLSFVIRDRRPILARTSGFWNRSWTAAAQRPMLDAENRFDAAQSLLRLEVREERLDHPIGDLLDLLAKHCRFDLVVCHLKIAESARIGAWEPPPIRHIGFLRHAALSRGRLQ
jgi:hypothetical protein